MSGYERQSRVIAEVFIPAVIDTSDWQRDWKYSGWRVKVTNTADTFLANHLLNLHRS